METFFVVLRPPGCDLAPRVEQILKPAYVQTLFQQSSVKTAGRIRREKVGVKSAAVKLYQKRKTEVLEGKKLPEQLRARVVRFAEIADDALAYCEANNQGQQFDAYRIGRRKREFWNYAAELPVEELRKWFREQEWQPGTHNRYKSTLSVMFRLAIENKKASTNPARSLKRKREDNGPGPLLEPTRAGQNRSGVHDALRR